MPYLPAAMLLTDDCLMPIASAICDCVSPTFCSWAMMCGMFISILSGVPFFMSTAFHRNASCISTDNIGMSIGKRIKEVRKELKLSQAALCAKIGIHQSTLSELETGESTGTTYLARIAAALSVSALWLETGRGSREPIQDAPPPRPGGILSLTAETAAELRLLSVYRLANAREREAIDDVIEQMRYLIEQRSSQ